MTKGLTFVSMKDIKLDETGDLEIQNGDFVIGESTLQHQEHIIIANQGEYKEHPEVGVGIVAALLTEEPNQTLTRIKRQLEYDGMKVAQLRLNEDQSIDVDAQYQ